jgi:hypothetical protein
MAQRLCHHAIDRITGDSMELGARITMSRVRAHARAVLARPFLLSSIDAKATLTEVVFWCFRRAPTVSPLGAAAPDHAKEASMPERLSRSATLTDWPPALRQLVRAAEHECPQGHAAALRDLTMLALQKVPARGIFDPGLHDDHTLFAAIDAVAREHLELGEARAAWRTTIKRANLPLELRDQIEQSALQVQSVSDTTYFYAGLAFALAFVYGYRTIS